ncbi:putative oxidoreductase [Thelohanellus kitauei]|uniref:Putative oxidoreductase n=1 Tax=Thelohanellus kitauei TaxID=669202 RepID=A0A0C2MHJ6_THEKT|nr:putative oxidoreductase [Thelohanellus kitauei]
MVRLAETGKVKRIGVSNFTKKKLQWILDEDEKLANIQGMMKDTFKWKFINIFPQNEVIDSLKDLRIVVSSYCPLDAPNTEFKYINKTTTHIPKLLDDPLIIKIAINHMATPAQILSK